MKPVLLTPMWYGKHCTVQLSNGKKYDRVVRWNAIDGMYVVIATIKYREKDMEVGFKQEPKQK